MLNGLEARTLSCFRIDCCQIIPPGSKLIEWGQCEASAAIPSVVSLAPSLILVVKHDTKCPPKTNRTQKRIGDPITVSLQQYSEIISWIVAVPSFSYNPMNSMAVLHLVGKSCFFHVRRWLSVWSLCTNLEAHLCSTHHRQYDLWQLVMIQKASRTIIQSPFLATNQVGFSVNIRNGFQTVNTWWHAYCQIAGNSSSERPNRAQFRDARTTVPKTTEPGYEITSLQRREEG